MRTSTLQQRSRGTVPLSRGICRASPRQHLRQLRAAPRCSAAVSHEQASVKQPSITKVTLRTKETSALGVSIYPIFKYNASGGGGDGSVEQLGDKLQVQFDASKLLIPALSWRTASMFGVPIPPPLKIEITPSRLEGTIDLATGIVELEFDALFDFSAGPIYSAPSLVVRTSLTTESVQGKFRSATGQRMDAAGNARLAGVATVPKVDDMFMDTFLMLPTDALAIMDGCFTFE